MQLAFAGTSKEGGELQRALDQVNELRNMFAHEAVPKVDSAIERLSSLAGLSWPSDPVARIATLRALLIGIVAGTLTISAGSAAGVPIDDSDFEIGHHLFLEFSKKHAPMA